MVFKYILFSLQLEDLSILPKISDPRVNTAKLVFQKELENRENICQYIINIITVILTIVFSVFGGCCLGYCADLLILNNTGNTDSKMLDSMKTTILIVLAVYDASIIGVVISYFMREWHAQRNMGNVICFYLTLIIILLLFVLSSLVVIICNYNSLRCDKKEPQEECFLGRRLPDEKSATKCLFYTFSFAVSFHFSWVTLGIFANPLWAFPVLLTILTWVFLLYSLIYYRSAWQDKTLLKLFILMGITFFSYISFTWISARHFFTNEFISSSVQSVLMACVGLIAHIIPKKKK